MRGLKRAFMYCKKSMISVLLLVAIFVVVFTLLAHVRYLMKLADSVAIKIEQTEKGTINVFAKEDGFEIGVRGKTFSEEFIHRLEEQKGVKIQCYSGSVPAYGVDLRIYRSHESNRRIYEAIYEDYDYEKAQDSTMIGVSDLSGYPEFKKEVYKITKGRGITEEDEGTNVGVISDIIALNNKINVGDKVSYKIGSKEGDLITLEIIGIHTDGDNENGNTLGYAESMSQENLIFVPESITASISSQAYLNQISIKVQKVSTSEKLIEWMKETEPEAMEDAIVINQNYKYLEKISIIEAQKKYYMIVLCAGYGTAFAVLGLFATYLLIGRQREFGILRSLGESVGIIFEQILLELFFPFVISIPLGVAGALVVLNKIPVPDLILQYAQHSYMLRIQDVKFVLVMELLMLFCAVAIILIGIYTKSPKELLRGHES